MKRLEQKYLRFYSNEELDKNLLELAKDGWQLWDEIRGTICELEFVGRTGNDAIVGTIWKQIPIYCATLGRRAH